MLNLQYSRIGSPEPSIPNDIFRWAIRISLIPIDLIKLAGKYFIPRPPPSSVLRSVPPKFAGWWIKYPQQAIFSNENVNEYHSLPLADQVNVIIAAFEWYAFGKTMFNNQDQGEGESITQPVTELRIIAQTFRQLLKVSLKILWSETETRPWGGTANSSDVNPALCRGSTLVFDWHWQVVVNASRGRNQPFHISRFKNMTNRDYASRKDPPPLSTFSWNR